MSQKTRAPPSFQSIKSLPGDFRFSGLPASDQFGKSDDGKLGNSNVISSSIPENGGFEGVEVHEKELKNKQRVKERGRKEGEKAKQVPFVLRLVAGF
ncbi:hypothetical protein ACFX2I_028521 [Malus domestica]